MTRASWERIDVLFRFLVTGGTALALGLALWFLLLAADAFLFVGQISRHMHQPEYWPYSIFRSELGLGMIYGSVFFLAALLAARSRWSCSPALAAFAAYAIYVVLRLPDLRPDGAGFWSLLVPLLTAPLGGWLGGRFFHSGHR